MDHRGEKFESGPATALTDLVRVPSGASILEGDLVVPPGAAGLVLFAHGSGSGRHSERNRHVAQELQAARLATLLFDLLTVDEEALDAETAHLRFDIELLADRLLDATAWARAEARLADLPLGYCGASTGGAAALVAAARRPDDVGAVVSRGGRPDLAGAALPNVRAPTLLVVGEWDDVVWRLNEAAMRRMPGEVRLEIVPRATHLFEEPGALETVARLAREWFLGHLQ
jgi:pimeloyl-ACP methyl ester carboxylesterase